MVQLKRELDFFSVEETIVIIREKITSLLNLEFLNLAGWKKINKLHLDGQTLTFQQLPIYLFKHFKFIL